MKKKHNHHQRKPPTTLLREEKCFGLTELTWTSQDIYGCIYSISIDWHLRDNSYSDVNFNTKLLIISPLMASHRPNHSHITKSFYEYPPSAYIYGLSIKEVCNSFSDFFFYIKKPQQINLTFFIIVCLHIKLWSKESGFLKSALTADF